MAAVTEVGTGIALAITGATDLQILDLKFPKVERYVGDVTPLNTAATAAGDFYGGVKVPGKFKMLKEATAKIVWDHIAVETAMELGFAAFTLTYPNNGSMAGSCCIREVSNAEMTVEKELTAEITLEFSGILDLTAPA